MTSSPPPSEPSTILFRPSKKRKIYRQRAADSSHNGDANEETSSPPTTIAPAPAEQSLDELIASSAPNTEEDVEGTPVSISEILRLRKLRKPRVGGVEFRVESGGAKTEGAEGGQAQQIVRREEEEVEEVQSGLEVRRFAKQTGMVGDLNKHM